jgi:hypothetical protein
VQYRVTSVGGAWTQIAGLTATNETVTGLTPSTGYDFQVAAANSGGTGAFTATVTGTTAAQAASSTSASWNTYAATVALGGGCGIFNLYVDSGTAPTSVAIGLSTSQTVPPNPMPRVLDDVSPREFP